MDQATDEMDEVSYIKYSYSISLKGQEVVLYNYTLHTRYCTCRLSIEEVSGNLFRLIIYNHVSVCVCVCLGCLFVPLHVYVL